jgi:hypothetical protein
LRAANSDWGQFRYTWPKGSTSEGAVQVSRTRIHGYILDVEKTILTMFQHVGQSQRGKLGLNVLGSQFVVAGQL